jgi:hypothetical protein
MDNSITTYLTDPNRIVLPEDAHVFFEDFHYNDVFFMKVRTHDGRDAGVFLNPTNARRVSELLLKWADKMENKLEGKAND